MLSNRHTLADNCKLYAIEPDLTFAFHNEAELDNGTIVGYVHYQFIWRPFGRAMQRPVLRGCRIERSLRIRQAGGTYYAQAKVCLIYIDAPGVGQQAHTLATVVV